MKIKIKKYNKISKLKNKGKVKFLKQDTKRIKLKNKKTKKI